MRRSGLFGAWLGDFPSRRDRGNQSIHHPVSVCPVRQLRYHDITQHRPRQQSSIIRLPDRESHSFTLFSPDVSDTHILFGFGFSFSTSYKDSTRLDDVPTFSQQIFQFPIILPVDVPGKMLSLTTQSSFSKRKRPRSSLKVQTASCLLSAAAVLTVSIMPLGTTASLIGTSMLSVTPTASPASSPVVAYFGQDVQLHDANGRHQTNQSKRPVVIDSSSRDVDLNQDPQQTYMDSTASYPLSAGASSFLLQVDSPNEDRSHSAPPFSTDSPALKRRTQRSRQHSDRLLVRADPAATTSDDTSLGFTVRNNIASTYTSSGATTTFPSNAPSPTMLSPTPTHLPAAPTSAITLPSAFPQPFDQSLSYSLTASCVAFLARYLESEQMTGRTKGMKGSKTTLGKCGRPFGLLVSSSSRWAQM